jgi:hypothetical protein
MIENIPALVPGESNTGSLRDIFFIPVDDVTSILDAVSGLLPYNCLQDGEEDAVLYKAAFTEDTAELDVELLDKDGDEYYRTKIAFTVPKDYNFRPLYFNLMKRMKFFVITRDHENKSRLHGYINLHGEKYGLEFKYKYGSAKNRTGYKGYNCTFIFDSVPPPKAMGDISSIPVDPGYPIDPFTPGGIIVPPPEE